MTQELYGADCSRANAGIKLHVSGNHFRSYKLFEDLKSGSLWCEKKRFRVSIKGVMTRSMVDASRRCIPHSLHGFSIQTCVTTSLVYACKCICQTSALKPRNQSKHQQLRVNFLSRGQFWCVGGLKSTSLRALSMRIG